MVPSLLAVSVLPAMSVSPAKLSNISMNCTLPSALLKTSLTCQRWNAPQLGSASKANHETAAIAAKILRNREFVILSAPGYLDRDRNGANSSRQTSIHVAGSGTSAPAPEPGTVFPK